MELSKLSAKALEKELVKRKKATSVVCDALITAGRGHETIFELLTKTDSLASLYREAFELERLATQEKIARLKHHGSLKPIRH